MRYLLCITFFGVLFLPATAVSYQTGNDKCCDTVPGCQGCAFINQIGKWVYFKKPNTIDTCKTGAPHVWCVEQDEICYDSNIHGRVKVYNTKQDCMNQENSIGWADISISTDQCTYSGVPCDE